MLSYETAVKLKEVGFPQKKSGLFGMINHVPLKNGDLYIEGTVYLPPLNELIEACGDKIEAIVKENSKWTASRRWNNYEGIFDENGSGSSPEEAVANLWLALQSK